ncbi:MAG TPA: XRE family transcriptional regulator [Chitinophagaceae bacterium]|jgi:transcriptional regulator with XRE-family HTH domain|nr:XRE family transcriptional regulator [Chitinophagaceae bacterium]
MDRDSILEAFGKHLAQIRKERRLSIHQLAIACDMEYSHLQRIEKGKVNIALTTLLNIARGLDLSPEELMHKFKTPK